jgi:glucose-6-phosphate 1-dehydrogenase
VATFLILGARGDLTSRLLLPGLAGLLAKGIVEDLELVGSDLEEWDDESWRSRVAQSFAAADVSGARLDAVAGSARYRQADVAATEDLRRLLEECPGNLIVYFALPPGITARACEALTEVGVPEGTRLVMEKPFGSDAASAAALNRLVAQLVPEDHVHRVDHFLGMSAVLNILGVRFANRIVEPVLGSEHVDSVDIVFDESLALEGRADFYDNTGALEDMIQSHLLQVMSLVAMEAPPTLEAADVRDAKAKVLRAAHVWNDDPVTCSRRARYTAGEIDGRRLASYVDENGVDPERRTETFAELVLAVDTWRWAGVPFRVRSGKAIGSPRTEVTVTFKAPQLVPAGMTGCDQPDRLRIGISLDVNSLGLDLNITGPGDPFRMEPVSLEGEFGSGELPPYGEVLKGVFEGEPPLSVRGDMAVESWRIIEPVQKAWTEGRVPMQEYKAGSSGPTGWPETGLPGPVGAAGSLSPSDSDASTG